MKLDEWKNLQMHLSAVMLSNSLLFKKFTWNCNVGSKNGSSQALHGEALKRSNGI